MEEKVQAKSHENYLTYTLLSVILPVVGLILGIAYMTKDNKQDRKLGEHLVAISIIFMILWGVGFLILTMGSQTAQTYSN